MFGVLIDTVVICTATAAIVLMSGMMDGIETSRSGIILVQQAFSAAVGGWGSGFIVVIVFLFAFTSIMANYTYAENNLLFLNQDSRALKFLLRFMVLTMVMFGTQAALPLVWQLADVAMA
ncbi:alanine:cation symporter family protein, partial [Cronobacter malonaticus]